MGFDWAAGMGGTEDDHGSAIVVDASGNVYTTGSFEGTADFDPGPGTANLISAGYNDVFVSKLDASGNYLWAKRMGGTDDDFSDDADTGSGIAVDTSGNVYITGSFGGQAGDSDYPTYTKDFDIFVSKLDSSGNYLWVKQMGGTGDDFGSAIAVDAAGYVYTTGCFVGTADFDPGPDTVNLTSAGDFDIFVSKLDASGNNVWAESMGGTGHGSADGIAVDSSGNVYTAGDFEDTADFDPGHGTANLTSEGSFDIFVSKLDGSGEYVWAKSMGGTRTDVAEAIAIDTLGNVYTMGNFYNTADFDPGPGTANLTSVRVNDIFVSKLDASGNYLWAKSMGGADEDRGFGMAIDTSGSVHTTGYFSGTADFDPGPGTAILTSAGKYDLDIFVCKLDASGIYLWAKRMGRESDLFSDYGFGIAVDASGNLYTTGQFSGLADFDPGVGTVNLNSAGEHNYDIFVCKLTSTGL